MKTIEKQVASDTVLLDAQVRQLDELRLGLLTDLSHELRTPLTAMKLGMQGLCSQLRGTFDPQQQVLADISRRNIDRVVTMIENQLELLQMILGETRVDTRLVEMNQFVSEIMGRLGKRQGNDWVRSIEFDITTTDSEIHVLTDGDALHSIVGCLLSGGAPGARRSVSLNADEDGGVCTLTIRIDYLGAVPEVHVPDTRPETAGGNVPSLVSPPSSHDFETRALTTLMAALDGTVDLDRDSDYKEVHLHIPLYTRD